MLAPLFLVGLLAIGVPIWLHRVAKANPQRFAFASLMFVEASETQKTAQRVLRYLLLLAMRILLLILLAFAFAGPLLSGRLAPPTAATTRLHAIVLDTSLSMQYGDRWQRALDEASGVIDKLGGSDRVMLVTASGRRMSVVHEAVPSGSAGSVRAALRSLKPGIDRLDYGLLMSTAKSWLGSPRPPTQLHLISDLQQTAGPLRFADLEPPADTELVLHDVGQGAAVNTYIESAALTSVDTRKLEVVLRSNAVDAPRREVVLTVDGKEVARQPTTIVSSIGASAATPSASREGEGSSEPGTPSSTASVAGTGKALFPNLQLSPGAHRIELALEPSDALAQDDKYYAVIEHADPRVLLVARSSNADDAAYFGAAIGSLSAPRLQVEQNSATTVAESSGLAGYSAIVVADTSVLTDIAAKRIRDYVAAGGAVLATLGQSGNSQTSTLLEGLRVTGTQSQAIGVGNIVTSHPILRDAAEWHRVRFFRHVQVEPGKDDKVLIALEDGSPLLIERAIGAGKLLLFTAPLDRNWNDLAVHPLFVRFIAEAARYLTGHDASALSATAGSVVMTGLTTAASGQIFDPQGRRVLDLGAADADRLVPEQTGFYEIRGGEGARWLAVNVDARESNLSRLPDGFVQRWRALRAPQSDALAHGEGAEAAQADAPPPSTRSLGPWLLLLGAVVLLIELLMANHYLAIRREAPQ
jgi:hypothetical protein